MVIRSTGRRLSEHRRNLARVGLTIGPTRVYEMDALLAWEIEREIKYNFPLKSQVISGFMTEATSYELYQNVIDFVERKIFDTVE